MYVYRIYAGIPLDADGPGWEVWLLVIGGALGAGFGRVVHSHILISHFGYSGSQEQKAWRGP